MATARARAVIELGLSSDSIPEQHTKVLRKKVHRLQRFLNKPGKPVHTHVVYHSAGIKHVLPYPLKVSVVINAIVGSMREAPEMKDMMKDIILSSFN